MSITRPFYGNGSSPTAKQLLEGIVRYGGNCYELMSFCSSKSHEHELWRNISNRFGDNCPLWVPGTFCDLSLGEKVAAARKLLMGDVVYECTLR